MERETSNKEILNMDLTMPIEELLDVTVCEMRNHTKLFEKDKKRN